MPAELPGFYFDEARNRYFPLSSKPKHGPMQKEPVLIVLDHNSEADSPLKRKRRRITSWSANEIVRMSFSASRRYRAAQRLNWMVAPTASLVTVVDGCTLPTAPKKLGKPTSTYNLNQRSVNNPIVNRTIAQMKQ
ncbi:hypothetical protein H0H87_006816 [Tephrocybe sp. NHM501043]|nr:hypothetical protein H0H87_006816 [Tephrocybe sp. NHM501043]